jgi:thiosulfate dehydrogenase
MKRSWLILLAATWSSVALMTGRNVSAAESIDIDLTRWTPPDISTVADDPFGKLVKYGHALFTDTANEIGPTVSDPTRRFAGNNLTCQNCHLQAGTQPYAMPLLGVWGQFPQYRAQERAVERGSKIASTVAWSAA